MTNETTKLDPWTDLTDEEYQRASERAEEMGRERGVDLAAWWEQDAIGGRASGDTKETARRVLAGLEDGDPEILDSLPRFTWGEWAGDYTVADFYDDMNLEIEDDHALVNVFEDAVNESVEYEVARMCREHLEG